MLYEHGGSLNHGCEALIRTISAIAKEKTGAEVTLCSYAPREDHACGMQEAVDVIVQNDQVLRRFSPAWFVYQFDKRVTHSKALQDRFLTEKTRIGGGCRWPRRRASCGGGRPRGGVGR